MSRRTKVAVLYRVVQEWRRPIFERLHAQEDLELKLFHGPDFIGSKVVSSKKKTAFLTEELFSFKLRKKSKNGLIAMPLSPFLFFKLLLYRPEVVLSEGASNLFNAITGFIYCKLFNKRFIWWSLGKLNGTTHTGFRKKLDVIIQFIERNSDAIISYSTLGKKYFEDIGISRDRIFVAVNVVDTSSKLKNIAEVKDFDPIEKIRASSKMVVLFVGALTPQKRLDVLVRAFHQVSQKTDDIKLIIVGDGVERKAIEDLIQTSDMQNITLTGKVFDGVEKYFMAADLFVLPGLGGLAISEAMLYGLPVIASIGDGCEKDLIESGKNGIIDEHLDVQSLARYIFDLYENPEKLKGFQVEAKRTILEEHNIETYLDQVTAAIKA